MRTRCAALAAIALAACSRGHGEIHVQSIRLAEGALAVPLQEAGLDAAALDAAARGALRQAGFEVGEGARPHRATLDVVRVRLRGPETDRSGARVEVSVELELAPVERGAPGTHRDAGTALAPIGGSPGMREAWLAALRDATRLAAEGIAIALDEEQKAIPALVADVSAKDARVQEQAVRVLADRRSREAVPSLLERLRAGDPRTVNRIAGALAQIGDERAVPALIEVARGPDPSTASRMLRFIGDIGGAEAQGYLLTIEAGDPDPRARRAAREALAEMAGRAKEGAVAAGNR